MDYNTIRRRIETGYYKPKTKYPDRPKRDPLLTANVEFLSAEELCKIPSLRTEFAEATTAYNKQCDIYREEDGKLQAEFENDCAEAFGMAVHPKRGKLWGKVWDHGHANGYSDLLSWYSDLADLFVD